MSIQDILQELRPMISLHGSAELAGGVFKRAHSLSAILRHQSADECARYMADELRCTFEVLNNGNLRFTLVKAAP